MEPAGNDARSRSTLPRTCATWIVLAIALWSLAAAANAPARVAGADTAFDPRDLVFVTEDNANRIDGCDAISVGSVRDGSMLHRGRTEPSPGRMVARRDLTLILANHVQRNQIGPFIYQLGRTGPTDQWSDSRLRVPNLVPGAALGLMHDGDTLLVPFYDRVDDSGFLGPFTLKKFDLRQVVGESLGPSHGSLEITSPPVRIFPSKNGAVAHVVTSDSVIHTIRIADMSEAAPRIRMNRLVVPASGDGARVTTGSATISSDHRYIFANRWTGGEVNIADLETRTSVTVDTAAEISGGLAYNHGWINRDVLALHGRSRILTFQFVAPDRLEPRGLLTIPPPNVSGSECDWRTAGSACNGPVASIAWSTSGDMLIAASDDASAEFGMYTVDDDGRSIDPSTFLTACPWDEGAPVKYANYPNDILTGNGFFDAPTPTASASHTPESPTPTAIATASPPTPLATATQSPSPTASSTATSLPTATQAVSRPIFLPLLLVEQCPPADLFVDVVLVIDSSSSMRELAENGRPKIDLAVEASEIFLDGLRLERGRDRAAIVNFNDDADTLQLLTDDRARLRSALGRVRVNVNSRVDLGIERAMVELVARGRVEHLRAMVLLSDGMVNQVSRHRPAAVARRARGAGISIYVVGMGPAMDAVVLREMSSGPEFLFTAPSPLLLRAIYTDLTERVPCPAGSYWGRR